MQTLIFLCSKDTGSLFLYENKQITPCHYNEKTAIALKNRDDWPDIWKSFQKKHSSFSWEKSKLILCAGNDKSHILRILQYPAHKGVTQIDIKNMAHVMVNFARHTKISIPYRIEWGGIDWSLGKKEENILSVSLTDEQLIEYIMHTNKDHEVSEKIHFLNARIKNLHKRADKAEQAADKIVSLAEKIPHLKHRVHAIEEQNKRFDRKSEDTKVVLSHIKQKLKEIDDVIEGKESVKSSKYENREREILIQEVLSANRFFNAVKQNNKDLLTILSDAGADVNMCDGHKETPLFYAVKAEKNPCELVDFLLSKGADINKTNDCRESPLMEAVKTKNTDLVRLLSDKGADANLQNDAGDTALILAAKQGLTQAAQLLSDKGADVNTVNKSGMTALAEAVNMGDYNITQLLTENGADLNTGEHIHTSPLLTAAQKGYADIVAFLIQKGADINKTDDKGTNALMIALSQQHNNIVKYLLNNTAIDVNLKNENNKTALMIACQKANADTVELLLKKNPQIEASDCDGKNAFDYAEENKENVVVELLKNFSEK